MESADNYEEWQYSAQQLDQMKSKQTWRQIVDSKDYDFKYVLQLKNKLKESREQSDINQIINIIRSHSYRNIANIMNPELYKECLSSTKNLIEEFFQELERCLEFIEQAPTKLISQQKKLEFFIETKHALGRSAFIFSGGGLMGMYHLGVIKVLHKLDLIPRIIAGSSAGSIVSSMYGCWSDDEIAVCVSDGGKQINWKSFLSLDQRLLPTAVRRSKMFLQKGLILDIRVVQNFVRDNIGDITFQEAFDKTGRILNITVTAQTKNSQDRLLNYLTAPNVVVWSAVACSCSIPYVYGPSELLCKNEKGVIEPYLIGTNKKFVDGSVGGDLPKQQLSELFNVNTFFVSQTNPFVVPFIDRSDKYRLTSKIMYRFLKTVQSVKSFVFNELQHRVRQLIEFNILPFGLEQLAKISLQEYEGNVTIFQNPEFMDYINILQVPNSDEQMERFIRGGQRSTYNKIFQIQTFIRMEKNLEISYKNVREKIIFDLPISIAHSQQMSEEDYLEQKIWVEDVDETEDIKKGKIVRAQSIENIRSMQKKYSCFSYVSSGSSQDIDVINTIKKFGVQEIPQKSTQRKQSKWSLNYI